MTMTKLAAAIAGLTALFAVTEASAQLLGRPAAPLQNAMTERQAKAACRTEMAGGRSEGRKAMAKKTSICVQNKMNGTNR